MLVTCKSQACLFCQDLGQMPSPTMADKLAFWAAALVNPLPALGVTSRFEPRVESGGFSGHLVGGLKWTCLKL